MQAYCLADLFNLRMWRKGQEPTYADVRDGLSDLVAASLTAIGSTGRTASDLLVRLYGGWYGDSLGDRVELRELAGAVIDRFPRAGKPRLRFQLAEAPVWDPSIRLLRSVRRVSMKPTGVKISTPLACAYGGACSLRDLASWWKGRCPDSSCQAKLGDVAVTKRQKMVDTLMTADALTIARDGLADVLILATDDDDLLPALLALSNSQLQAIRLRRDTTSDPYYDGILSLQGLLTHNW